MTMSGIQDFEIFYDDFNGTVATFPTSADPATAWLVDDTSANGAPTYTKGTSVATLKLANTNEEQNVCLHFNDALDFDIDDIQRVEIRCRLDAVLTTGTEVVWGVGSARNDTTDSVACNAWFKMVGANSTTLVYVETDDGVVDDDDNSTGETLGTTFKRFVIDFNGGKSDVKFYIDGKRVLPTTTFSLAGYSAGLQPLIQIQKAANTNVNGIVIDYVKVTCHRRA